jgi:integration host factor subunit alpha
MTKADIVEKVHAKIGGTTREAASMLETVLEIMKSILDSGDCVKIAGFGKFSVKEKKDRKGRNPQTGEAIVIEARRILSFKVSEGLRDRINA